MTMFSRLLKFFFAPHFDAAQKLKNAPKELFNIFLINFFTAFGMAGPGAIMVNYFSDEFHMTDVEASTLFACSSIGYVLFGLLTGTIIDRIGIKNSLIFGGVLGVVCTMMIALAASRGLLMFAVLVVLPLSTTFVAPVVKIAQKRYTYVENKRIAFMFAYLIYNLGAAVSFFYVDFVRFRFSEGVRFRSYSTTAARVIFMSGAVSILFGSIVAACGLRDVMVDDKGVVKSFSMNSDITNDQASQNERVRKRWYMTYCEPDFARFVAYALIMLPLLKMFTHFDVTFPKAAVRELGSSVAFGTIKAWNPVIIFVFQIYFSHWFRNFHIYNVIIIGSTIAALSVFVFCAPPSYTSFSMAFILFTIGEMIFSHRVDDFATDMMPKGREGTYSTQTGIYLIVPGYLINSTSGWLLSAYCPAEGVRMCQMMWFIIGLMSCITPLMLFACKKYLLKPPAVEFEGVQLENTPGSTAASKETPIRLDDDNDYVQPRAVQLKN